MDNNKKKRFLVRQALIKKILFFALLLIFAFIGLIWFARPKISEFEKRELTKFPKITISGILDGSFFSGVDKWYSDTYPLRESLISRNSKLQSLYGIRSEQLIEATTEEPETTTEPAKPADPDDALEEGLGDVDVPAESAGTIYIAKNSGYGVYNYDATVSARYAKLLSQIGTNLAGKANVYNIIVPISAGVMLSDDVQKSIHCDDEDAAIQAIYSQEGGNVTAIPIFHALKKHNSEYIYFHTDHHWTALGAYYGYREFCKVKEFTPNEITSYKTVEFTGFLGSFYTDSNRSPVLAQNPDTITAYVPNGADTLHSFIMKGKGYIECDWPIINDVSSYPESEMYSTFSGADQPYSYVHNETKTDGSSVLVVKDSFANAFIPFLVDHYEYVYWIDYRHYPKYCNYYGISDATISGLVSDKGIQDVLIMNSINSTGTSKLLDQMELIYK